MKKIIITAIIIFVVIVGGYIAYDQLITDEETEPADTNKETNINSIVEDTDMDDSDSYSREYVAKGIWGSVPAITVDASDTPHVAFYNREFGDLIYATKTNGLWQHEIVDSEGRGHVAHTYALDDSREMAPEVVEREEDDLEQIIYQLVQ